MLQWQSLVRQAIQEQEPEYGQFEPGDIVTADVTDLGGPRPHTVLLRCGLRAWPTGHYWIGARQFQTFALRPDWSRARTEVELQQAVSDSAIIEWQDDGPFGWRPECQGTVLVDVTEWQLEDPPDEGQSRREAIFEALTAFYPRVHAQGPLEHLTAGVAYRVETVREQHGWIIAEFGGTL